jgi:hypothetical protein
MTSRRRVLTILLAALIALPVVVSCEKINQMMGQKDEKAEQLQATQQKLAELETKMQQMQAEDQARKDAEAKAKAEQEMKDKIEADLKAQMAATQPAAPPPAPTAAVTAAPTTQPATPPAAAATAPAKVVEKVIVKEVPAKPAASAAPASAAPAAEAKPTGYVKLWDDAGFTDRSLTVHFGRDIGNMRNVNSDDGKSGFNDKCSSVKWSVPPGWQAVLYENDNYSKRGYVLKGTGSVPDLGYFGDKTSSLRWEKASE